jgi:cell division protease FtsH
VTTGAQNDLKAATDLARQMVGLWGMSEEIGPVFLGLSERHVFLGRELTQEPGVGAALLDRADDAIRRLLDEAEARAVGLLREHRAELERLADALIAEETLDEAAIRAVIGAPTGPAADRAADRAAARARAVVAIG